MLSLAFQDNEIDTVSSIHYKPRESSKRQKVLIDRSSTEESSDTEEEEREQALIAGA